GGVVQVLRVPLVEAVLGGEAPVALADIVAAAEHQSVLDQLGGDITLDGRGLGARLHIADVHPQQAQPFLDRIRRDTELSTDGTFGTVGDDRVEPAGLQAEGPAVIGAADGAGEFAATVRQRHTAVRAPVVQAAYDLAVADQHDTFTGEGDRHRLLAYLVRPDGRIPVVAEAVCGRVVGRPARPVRAVLYGRAGLEGSGGGFAGARGAARGGFGGRRARGAHIFSSGFLGGGGCVGADARA